MIAGILARMYGVKRNEVSSGESSRPQEDWDVYICDTADGPAAICVDLAARPPEGQSLDVRSLVRIKLQEAGENGFNTKEEGEILYKLEDTLEEYVQVSLGGKYVGRTTHDGYRVFCFYVPAGKQPTKKNLLRELREFGEYTPECSSNNDAEWRYFFEFLYPSPQEIQCIQNRRVVDSLVRNGDTLEKPREIDHWIFFRTLKEREAFREKVLQDGFNVREERLWDDGRYSLQVYRNDRVSYEDIDDIVLPLWELAQEHSAEYDGWETLIVKEDVPTSRTKR